jgi:formamidopyrimidine-DNA glycosylase
MPELPEVETIVRDLNRKVLNRAFLNVWSDEKRLVKKPGNFEEFKKKIKGKKILKIWRRAKNIIFNLSGGYILLIHQKLTGHLLCGKWKMTNGKWQPLTKGPLEDPKNRFIHLVFWLDNNDMIALCDLRKFAKVELLDKEELKKELSSFGPEPLAENFTFEKFKEVLAGKKGKIKQILMNQEIIAGIGNIYSDEVLWRAKVHPQKDVSELKESELELIYQNIKKVLQQAIKLRGESISDFRDTSGEKGFFDTARKVYQREGEKCPRCGTIIKRLKIGGRSAHFCPNCQKP